MPRDPADEFRTGEILQREFELIHGAALWDPPDMAGGMRDQLMKVSEDELPHDPDEAARLATYLWSAHCLPDAGPSALCLSGGGIRSAAFALGIMQGLARHGLLDRFHYLSTVSGGGYIGSWFTAWRKRAGLDAVLAWLGSVSKSWFAEALELRRLRFNQNFLTPRVGLASPDTWAAVAMVVRNIVLNWLVYLPLIASVLLLPRLMEVFLRWVQDGQLRSSLVILGDVLAWLPTRRGPAPLPTSCWEFMDLAAVLLIFLGFTISARVRPTGGGTGINQSRFMAWIVLPVMLGVLLLTGSIASWFRSVGEVGADLRQWIVFGALVYALARFCAPHYPPEYPAAGVRDFKWKLLSWAVAGITTGLLIGAGVEALHGMWTHLPLSQCIGMAAWPRPECEARDLAAWLAVAGPPWIVLSFLSGEAVYVGVTSRLADSERDREWLARAAGCFGAIAIAYLLFCWLVIFGWPAITAGIGRLRYLAIGTGLLSVLGALTPLTQATAATATPEKLPITPIVTLLSGIFVLAASAALAQTTLDLLGQLWTSLSDWMPAPVDAFHPEWRFAPGTEWVVLAASWALLLGASMGVSYFVNVNWFSMHALYRNRLVKTFLGASKPAKDTDRNRFDGFSPTDNLPISSLEETVRADRRGGAARLYPVVNMALNVVATSNLAWQQRKAEAFVATPLFTGGDRVGYRPSREFGSTSQAFPEGLTLGTAMAISGAAASPNWGYHSSPITSLLMMLANLRLGWWMGNPKRRPLSRVRRLTRAALGASPDRQPWKDPGPRASWLLFIKEALGQTDDNEDWIYLSDGGHFENLGLYEMMRRRCRTIVVSDAGADPDVTLEDLGNAVRKIAIDLRVKIDFKRIHMRKRSAAAAAGAYFAIGDIRYPEGRPGKILYIKPGFYGTEEPADVRAYAAANAKFPHESTLNQWFGESQFESYRALGAFVIEEICRNGSPATLQDFIATAEADMQRFEKTLPADGSTLVEIREPVTVRRGAPA